MKPNLTENEALLKFEALRNGVLKQLKESGKSVEERQSFVPPWHRQQLIPPFTYFGGKRKIATQMWNQFGSDVPNYIEPFAGGLSVLLARPATHVKSFDGRYRELVNDTNLLLLNFWRTIQQKQFKHLSRLMDFPAHEFELLERRREMTERAKGLAPKLQQLTYCDPKLAAYWLYTQREWIGAGADDLNSSPKKKMVRARASGSMANSLDEHLEFLKVRTRNVRFFCGDWQDPNADEDWVRSLKSPTQTTKIGTTGVFLDPPYVDTGGVYGGTINKLDTKNVTAFQSREWAIANGNNPAFRIAYCGYKRHHVGAFPNDWVAWHWQEAQGYTKAEDGSLPEIDTVWFSPHCLHLDSIARLKSVD